MAKKAIEFSIETCPVSARPYFEEAAKLEFAEIEGKLAQDIVAGLAGYMDPEAEWPSTGSLATFCKSSDSYVSRCKSALIWFYSHQPEKGGVKPGYIDKVLANVKETGGIRKWLEVNKKPAKTRQRGTLKQEAKPGELDVDAVQKMVGKVNAENKGDALVSMLSMCVNEISTFEGWTVEQLRKLAQEGEVLAEVIGTLKDELQSKDHDAKQVAASAAH